MRLGNITRQLKISRCKPILHCRECAVRARRGGGGYFGDEGLIKQSGLNMTGANKLDFGKQGDGKKQRSVLEGIDLGGAIDLTPVDDFGQGGQSGEQSAINYDPEGS